MKKLLVLLFSFFLLSSSSVFAETYFCDGFISHILKRQGSVFSYKSPSVKSTLEIVKEDSKHLFLMGNFHSDGGSVMAINKITNKFSMVWISPNTGESSEMFSGKCMKD
jgi:hypothetical protein